MKAPPKKPPNLTWMIAAALIAALVASLIISRLMDSTAYYTDSFEATHRDFLKKKTPQEAEVDAEDEATSTQPKMPGFHEEDIQKVPGYRYQTY